MLVLILFQTCPAWKYNRNKHSENIHVLSICMHSILYTWHCKSQLSKHLNYPKSYGSITSLSIIHAYTNPIAFHRSLNLATHLYTSTQNKNLKYNKWDIHENHSFYRKNLTAFLIQKGDLLQKLRPLHHKKTCKKNICF